MSVASALEIILKTGNLLLKGTCLRNENKTKQYIYRIISVKKRKFMKVSVSFEVCESTEVMLSAIQLQWTVWFILQSTHFRQKYLSCEPGQGHCTYSNLFKR